MESEIASLYLLNYNFILEDYSSTVHLVVGVTLQHNVLLKAEKLSSGSVGWSSSGTGEYDSSCCYGSVHKKDLIGFMD